MASVSSVSNTNLSTEARINFGKLSETPERAISLQNWHISGQIEAINIEKGYVTFSRSEFSVSPGSIDVNSLFQFSTFLTAEEQIFLYHAF